MKLAAIDIGSNSLHLVVAETDHEKPFRVIASAKEVVRLGRSAARDRRLSNSAMDRAVECLRRFRKTAEMHGAEAIIAAATSAVREAMNREQFLKRAATEAGIHVEILSGIEEARLIALAVSARYRQTRQQRSLVIDIGGGSTELAVMKQGEPAVLISFKLGAVRLTEQYAKSDPIGEKQLRRLRTELHQLIGQRAPEIHAVGFDTCYGTSGTITALAGLSLRRRLAAGIPRRRQEPSLKLEELRLLNEELSEATLDERIRDAQLNRSRAEIIVAGGQLLEALLEELKVDLLVSCDWALREGVIIAHLARRVETISNSPTQVERDPSLRGAIALARRYQVDLNHAHRVSFLAQRLFDELRPLHALGGEHRRMMIAAALLHDIGYFVSHTGHHKHSAYLIQHSDWSGFTSSEIAIIANLARYHRMSMPKEKHPYFMALAEEDRETVRKLSALLRLADAFDRDHGGAVRDIHCEILPNDVRITAHCSREAEAMLWRLEERSDLFIAVYGKGLEIKAEVE